MRFLKPGRLIIYIIIISILWNVFGGKITLDAPVVIKEGQSAGTVLTQDLGWIDSQRLKRAFRNRDSLRTLQPGSYEFTGSYTTDQIVEILEHGPTNTYQRVTILEGRNSRDVDNKLSSENLADSGAYRSFITDAVIIDKYIQRYDFLRQAKQERGSLSSLEGYLYPETYMLDGTKDTIDQLVYLQLETFQQRVRKNYGDQLLSLTTTLKSKGYTFSLSTYGALTLASIIEKEESVDTNKPLIASIFFNRLESGMRLDADISLCYGFQEPYASCTPSRIAEHLSDTNNPYNTRAVTGLPPTPISTVHTSSLQALFDAPKTEYLFYLHNSQGKIFPATTNAEHNLNKSKEL